MARHQNYLTILSWILASSILTGCSVFRAPEKEIVTVTEVITPKIQIAERPKPVQLSDIYFHVVTEDNFEEFKSEFLKRNGDFVYYAISVRDYENMALNLAELRRFILQQKEVIIYYEQAVSDSPIDIPTEK